MWLTENPGYHAPQDVAVAVQCTTHQAAVSLRDLLERGLVTRADHQYGANGYTKTHEHTDRSSLPDPDDAAVAVGG